MCEQRELMWEKMARKLSTPGGTVSSMVQLHPSWFASNLGVKSELLLGRACLKWPYTNDGFAYSNSIYIYFQKYKY